MHQIFHNLAIRGGPIFFRGISPIVNPVRNGSKHWDPKFRKLRGKKVIKIELPDYDEVRKDEKLTIEEMRSKMKEKGIVPHREWDEKPMFISSSGVVFDPYVPPEGDGKISLLSKTGVKEKTGLFSKKGKSFMALRKIRRFEYDFDVPTLADKAQETYVEVHNLLQNFRESENEDKLHELVTEKCYPELVENIGNKTVRWKFIQSLEIPRIVQIRCEELLSKENVFAQVTVRFHTQQVLAVYDRFGRLMHGSEDIVKDVLEFVVFEKHMTNLYGCWRLHAKIIPSWLPKRDPILKTFVKPQIPKVENVTATTATATTAENDTSGLQPAVA